MRMEKSKGAVTNEDTVTMRKIRNILNRGNSAEVKRKKDGSLAIMEVKKRTI